MKILFRRDFGFWIADLKMKAMSAN